MALEDKSRGYAGIITFRSEGKLWYGVREEPYKPFLVFTLADGVLSRSTRPMVLAQDTVYLMVEGDSLKIVRYLPEDRTPFEIAFRELKSREFFSARDYAGEGTRRLWVRRGATHTDSYIGLALSDSETPSAVVRGLTHVLGSIDLDSVRVFTRVRNGDDE